MGRKICGFLSALVLVVIVAVCIPMTVPRLAIDAGKAAGAMKAAAAILHNAKYCLM